MKLAKVFTIFIAITFIATSGFGCKLASREEQAASQRVELDYWSVFDETSSIQPLIDAYRAKHPNVIINYKMYRYDEYEDKLLNALAEDRGPDMYAIHNSWVREYEAKILPLPSELTIAYIERTGGTLGEETKITIQTERSLTLRQLRDQFVETVYDDAVLPIYNEKTKEYENKIMGLPLSVDTLSLFYNRDLLNAAGIAEPPATWVSFQEQVSKITKIDKEGNIAQSAAAIGTADNVERYADILSILMMQNGTQMTNEAGFATFNKTPDIFAGRTEPPGWGAVRFYTDFANPAKEVYTWNDSMPNSLDAFSAGQTAFFFGYSYHLPQIKTKAPKLNFGVARLPQLEGNPEINYANYWLNTVSKKTENQDYAWDFVQFIAEQANVKTYLETAKKPTALRALQAEQLEDLDLSVFASQILTAKSWYRGKDVSAMEQAFAELIESQVYGTSELKDAINLAASKINQTIQ